MPAQSGARTRCARREIVFTSGGSESDNTVFNLARDMIDAGATRNRIVTSTIEHPAIIETCAYLEKHGYSIDYAPVDQTGKVRLDVLQDMMGDDVLLVSVMAGNNETGTIQDIVAISTLAHRHGALMHTDAVQAVGKMHIDGPPGVDYLSLSAHKFYGPKGIGALYVRKGAPFEAFMKGGHQEGGRRAGTYNTSAIVAMGKAAEMAAAEVDQEKTMLWGLREKLRQGIEAAIPGVVVNGHPVDCLPGTLNVSFPGAEGESILLMLDYYGSRIDGLACATILEHLRFWQLATSRLAHGSINSPRSLHTEPKSIMS